ncbi:phosphatase PAP2 family protein [Spiroplasma eriocheiris]|uniref:Phosphatidic acid phosphatase type 2/haloperoxidase domain-containing protein n=1 Tax=Spiroplasma eriocheiris TaxID=315358 RepID=A0A0H3XI45_9MOLU|nr:phosphatase PAP2 family protein [Spiroplasma eriocheiris]AHF58069.1 putative phosphoesterase [Spiroplasma eriocheiris CCTCC M 207170]AKM54508.1 hypothetical protein SERIO_v1c09500 [Spiroplasma eriocheiris]
MKSTNPTRSVKANFFTNKNSHWYFFAIPLLIIFVINLGLLIASAWYGVDYQIAAVLAGGLNNEFGKYWALFYNQLGNTELFVVLLIYLAILLETLFLVKIKRNKIKFKNNYWIVNSYYIIVGLGWVIGNSLTIAFIPTTDEGFGFGIDYILLDSMKYRLTGSILAFIYQTVLLGLGLYYVRFKLVKTNRILTEQAWIKAVKGVSFLIITYLVVAILKGSTQRTYYYNAIFGDLIRAHPDLLSHYLQQSEFKYGYNLGSGYVDNIPWEYQYPWWKPTSLIDNPNMPVFNLPWEYAFPSGHINATFCSGALIILFLKNSDNKEVNWKVKGLFVIWLIHIISINFALIVERMHWISDTAFTFVFSILMILAVHFGVNKIFKNHLNREPALLLT